MAWQYDNRKCCAIPAWAAAARGRRRRAARSAACVALVLPSSTARATVKGVAVKSYALDGLLREGRRRRRAASAEERLRDWRAGRQDVRVVASAALLVVLCHVFGVVASRSHEELRRCRGGGERCGASPLGQPTAGALLRTTAANPCFAAELLAPTYMLRLECEARRRKRHAGGAGRSRTRPALSGMLRTRQAAPCTRSSRRSLPGVCPGARSVRRWGRARGSPAPRPRACTRQAAAASHCEQGRQHAPRQGGAPWAQQEITFAARRRGRAFRADRAASPTALQAPCWLARSQRPPPCVSGAPRSRPVPGTSCALPEAARAGAGSELRGGCEPAPLPLSLQASTCELRLQCEARRRDPVRGRWGGGAPASHSRSRPALSGTLREGQAAPCTRISRGSLRRVCRGTRSAHSWGARPGQPSPPRTPARQPHDSLPRPSIASSAGSTRPAKMARPGPRGNPDLQPAAGAAPSARSAPPALPHVRPLAGWHESDARHRAGQGRHGAAPCWPCARRCDSALQPARPLRGPEPAAQAARAGLQLPALSGCPRGSAGRLGVIWPVARTPIGSVLALQPGKPAGECPGSAPRQQLRGGAQMAARPTRTPGRRAQGCWPPTGK